MPTIQEDKLKKLLERAQEEAKELKRQVFIDDFISLTKTIVAAFKDLKQSNSSEMAKIKDISEKQGSELASKVDKKLELIQTSTKHALNVALDKQTNSLNFIHDKVSKLKDGEAGKDGLDGETPEVTVPQEVTDALEQDDKDIRALQKEVKELRESKKVGGGGGTSQASLKFALGKMTQRETPTGDIDGANKTYTTANQINTIMSFAINGQVITDDEYTFAKNTITMTTAIPAILSTTSFRIVYV